jgi:hypothetical protein
MELEECRTRLSRGKIADPVMPPFAIAYAGDATFNVAKHLPNAFQCAERN